MSSTRIYAFKAKRPHFGHQAASDQIYLAHQYANKLIESEQTRREAIAAAIRERFPRMVELDEQIAALDAVIEKTRSMMRAENARLRRRGVKSAHTAELKRLRDERKPLYEESRTIRRTAYGEPKARKEAENAIKKHLERFDRRGTKEAAVRAIREAISEGRNTELIPLELDRQAYGDLVLRRDLYKIDREANQRQRQLRAECGVFWGTYLHTEERISRAIVDSRPGVPAFQPNRGDGTLAVQIQSSKRLTWAESLAGADSRVRLEIEPIHARPTTNKRGQPIPIADPHSKRSQQKQRMVVWVRIGTEEDGRSPIWMKAIAHLHRHPPPDAEIKWVYIHRNRCGLREWWEAQFILAREDGWDKPVTEDGVCGINPGWRQLTDGLRVATLSGSDGHEEELILPPKLLARWSKSRSLRAIRDRNFDAIKVELGAWLKQSDHTVPDWLRERTIHLHAWRSCAKLGRVVTNWRTRRFAGDETIFETMEAWRKQDRHLHDWVSANITKAIRWRDDIYRNWADRIARQYHTVKAIKRCWQKIQSRPDVERPEDDPARGAFTIASVGRPTQLIEERVAEFMEVPAEYQTARCNHCGTIDEFDAGAHLTHECSHCGHEWDQDYNHARNVRDAEPEAAPVEAD